MILYYSKNIDTFDPAPHLPSLSAQRLEKALCYRRPIDRQLCVASYILLCRALKDHFAISECIVFDFGSNGKPYLRDYPKIFFNLSHCENAVVVALSTSEVGVDIQGKLSFKSELTKKVFCQNELEKIAMAEDKALAATRFWTRKEAHFKKLGIGIGQGLADFDSSKAQDVKTIFLDDYVISVANENAEKMSITEVSLG